MKMKLKIASVLLAALCVPAVMAHALNEEFSAEVLSVEGNCYSMNDSGIHRGLLEGDVIQEGDSIEVKEGGKLTLAFDKEWKNVVTIEENSQMLIDSIYPVLLKMTEGDAYAKLDALPKGSTFEVRTPVLVATVRGTEFRTVYKEGESEVLNFSDSDVTVYNHDNNGALMGEPVVLKKLEHTAAVDRGQTPEPPRPLTDMELYKGRLIREHIDGGVKRAVAENRIGKIQDVQKANRVWKEVQQRKEQVARGRASDKLSARREDFKTVDAPTPKRPSQLLAEEEARREPAGQRAGKDGDERKRIPKRQQPNGPNAEGPGQPGQIGQPGQPGKPAQPGKPGQGPQSQQPARKQGSDRQQGHSQSPPKPPR